MPSIEVDPALKNKQRFMALVTGGNRGIGLECVRRLCEELGDEGIIVMCSRQRPQVCLMLARSDESGTAIGKKCCAGLEFPTQGHGVYFSDCTAATRHVEPLCV